jgi:hypothetical protein
MIHDRPYFRCRFSNNRRPRYGWGVKCFGNIRIGRYNSIRYHATRGRELGWAAKHRAPIRLARRIGISHSSG